MSNSTVGTKRRHAEMTTAAAAVPTSTSDLAQTQTQIANATAEHESSEGSSSSDGDDNASDDSDSSSEVSEYVLVSLPGSLVTRMREQGGGSLQIHDLDSASPYFHSVAPSPPSQEGAKAAGAQQRAKYVGSYEYSVGTNLIWQIGLYDPSTGSTTPAAAADANSASEAPNTSAPPTNQAAKAAASSESENPRKLLKADPSLSFEGNKKDPRLDWVGKTWKKLVFARQR